MNLSKVDQVMLFTLGNWYLEAGKRLEGRPLQLCISKAAFIKAIMAAGMAGKKERALYRNLEDLEKRKLVSYKTKNLALTRQGEHQFARIQNDLRPYQTVLTVLSNKDPLTYTRAAQTRFRI